MWAFFQENQKWFHEEYCLMEKWSINWKLFQWNYFLKYFVWVDDHLARIFRKSILKVLFCTSHIFLWICHLFGARFFWGFQKFLLSKKISFFILHHKFPLQPFILDRRGENLNLKHDPLFSQDLHFLHQILLEKEVIFFNPELNNLFVNSPNLHYLNLQQEDLISSCCLKCSFSDPPQSTNWILIPYYESLHCFSCFSIRFFEEEVW